MNTLILRFCSVVCLSLLFKTVLGSTDEDLATAKTNQDNLRKLAAANNYLALNLHRIISNASTENIFFSPLSISSVLGMLFYGTRGETASELRNILGYDQADLPNEPVHQAFKQFLTDSSGNQQSEYQLSLANAILLDARLSLFASYKSGVQNLYHALVKEVDFERNGAEVVNEINSWVKTETNNKIDSLINELDPSTVMMLLSAAYFKGTWSTEFNKNKTTLRKFYNEGSRSNTKSVSFMHVVEKYNYTEVKDFKALELPYKGGHISMIILLPNRRKGFLKLEKSLTGKKLSTLRSRFSNWTVKVWLPKFKIEYKRELKSDLQELGAQSLFHERLADFSGMTNRTDLFVGEVLHKAVVEVDEKGSEAAAVTSVSVYMRSSLRNPNSSVFIADHPFLFFIIDKRSDMILFSGRVSSF